jgi:hypothetical protein
MISYDGICTRDILIYSTVSGDIIIYSSSNVKCKYHELLNLANRRYIHLHRIFTGVTVRHTSVILLYPQLVVEIHGPTQDIHP